MFLRRKSISLATRSDKWLQTSWRRLSTLSCSKTSRDAVQSLSLGLLDLLRANTGSRMQTWETISASEVKRMSGNILKLLWLANWKLISRLCLQVIWLKLVKRESISLEAKKHESVLPEPSTRGQMWSLWTTQSRHWIPRLARRSLPKSSKAFSRRRLESWWLTPSISCTWLTRLSLWMREESLHKAPTVNWKTTHTWDRFKISTRATKTISSMPLRRIGRKFRWYEDNQVSQREKASLTSIHFLATSAALPLKLSQTRWFKKNLQFSLELDSDWTQRLKRL